MLVPKNIRYFFGASEFNLKKQFLLQSRKYKFFLIKIGYWTFCWWEISCKMHIKFKRKCSLKEYSCISERKTKILPVIFRKSVFFVFLKKIFAYLLKFILEVLKTFWFKSLKILILIYAVHSRKSYFWINYIFDFSFKRFSTSYYYDLF